MLSKEELRKEFSAKSGEYYSVKLFEDEGFIRKQCSACGKHFWTSDSKRELCGDSEHEPYSFIKDKPSESIKYVEFWKRFSDFFKKEGHTEIPKYPVVSRWRQDLYFTIASIQDFQRIENGKMSFEYNANPIIVPQICLRFNDIPNVGVTGRHMTSFMMAGQLAFNYPKEGYWRDRTIELNYNLLTKIVGVKKKDLTYIEDVWAMGDFSEFGPCLESFSNGLELVNSVFTQFEYNNGKRSELKSKVVDVGWGFERLMWFKSGSQTAYDAAFGNELKYAFKSAGIKPDRKLYAKASSMFSSIDATEVSNPAELELAIIKKAGITKKEYFDIIKPTQAIYAMADHSRTLLFAINDGALPSNVGGGYNLRVLLRRMFDFISTYGIDIDLVKLFEMHAKDLAGLYFGLEESIDEITRIIEVEKRRYDDTKRSAMKTVSSIIDKGEAITSERMKVMYESNGISPEMISSIAAQKGVDIHLPEDFYSKILKSDFVEKRKHAEILDIETDGLPKTRKLFYNFVEEAYAKVIASKNNLVVLSQTPFYAESGGQEADHGTIDDAKVEDVKSIEGVIVHVLEKGKHIKAGTEVHCSIDVQRRQRLMAHHTATHLVSAAAREILGQHAWQEGAKKSASKAHIDVAHYERLNEEQVRAIEDKANSYIFNGIKVEMKEMPRSLAESEFGFSIYQGHGVPASQLRIVEIHDIKGNLIDAEACGGLHLMNRESSIGMIKITGASKIHDGINRIEFVAGPAAFDYIKAQQSKLERMSSILGVDQAKSVESLLAIMEESKRYKKELEKFSEKSISSKAEVLAAKGNTIIEQLDYDKRQLRGIATSITEANRSSVVLLYNMQMDVVCISGEDSGIDALNYVKEKIGSIIKGGIFKGGGTKKFAEGKITR